MSITGSNNPFACEPVVFANANTIVSLGTITRDGNEFTFSVGFVWKINGVTYQNTAPVVLTIAEASTGFQRIDNAILNTSNSIELQQGLESDTIALRPVAPETNIILTSWNISGDTVGDTAEPIIGTQFKKKSESAAYNDPTLSGSDAVIQFQPNGESVYAFSNAGLVSIDGFSLDLITGNPSAEVPYPGKDIFIFNNKSGNLTIKHDGSGTAQCKFFFIDETDLIIPPGGKVWLKYDPSYCEVIFKSWSDIDLSTKADLIDGKVPASQLPSYVDDVLEYANLAAFPVTGETGKIYIALDTNKSYRWSGSTYVQLSSGIDFPIDGKTYGVKDGLAVDLGVNIAKDFPNSIIIQASGAGVSYLGTYASTFTGTQSDILVGGGGVAYRKVLSASTAGSNANMYDAGVYRVQPGIGFYYRERIKNEDATNITSGRFSYGFSGTAIMGNINPSTYTQTLLSLAADNTDANCQIMYKNASGTATKIDLGATMPKTQSDEYVIEFLRFKGTTTIYYKITNLTTGVVAMNSFTFALNALALGNFRNNETVASACGFAFRRAELYITD